MSGIHIKMAGKRREQVLKMRKNKSNVLSIEVCLGLTLLNGAVSCSDIISVECYRYVTTMEAVELAVW
jgi:hypothetical protein